jgi:hypothetical protein
MSDAERNGPHPTTRPWPSPLAWSSREMKAYLRRIAPAALVEAMRRREWSL